MRESEKLKRKHVRGVYTDGKAHISAKRTRIFNREATVSDVMNCHNTRDEDACKALAEVMNITTSGYDLSKVDDQEDFMFDVCLCLSMADVS